MPALFENIKPMYGWIQKKNILIILGWSALISFLAIKSFWLFYLQNVKFYNLRITFRYGEGPGFTEIDAILIIAMSFLVSMLYADAKKLVWTYVTSIALSFVAIATYIFYYMWYVLDYASPLCLTPFGWEEILLLAIMNALRFMFPWGVFISLIGLITGSFLKSHF